MAMHYEALAIRRKNLDSMHPDVAQSLSNIAELLRERLTVFCHDQRVSASEV